MTVNMIDQTLEVCEKIVAESGHIVEMNPNKYLETADIIKKELPRVKNFWGEIGFKYEFEKPEDKEIYTVLYELIASSINYNYWFGCSKVRPCDASSTRMDELLLEAFNEVDDIKNVYMILNIFIVKLNENRFPNLKSRLNHLKEIGEVAVTQPEVLVRFCTYVKDHTIEESMYWLTQLFPGFGEDMFLKRANLFFGMLNRRMGYLEDQIDQLIIPADYHIPNVLRHFGCLSYTKVLREKINNSELILENSLEECAIRASSILVCKKIAELAGCTMTDVDTVLFLKRQYPSTPFHLTITSNY